MNAIHVAVDSGDHLGEVPLWSAARQTLFWIDVRKPALHALALETRAVRTFAMPGLIGSYCETSAGRMLVALKTGLYFLDLDSGQLQSWFDPEPALSNNRLNDGKCDRQGRFWVGSMNDGDRLPTGTLYSINGNAHATAHFDGITIPNSLAFSPDGRRMYFSDTPTRRIMVYDVDVADGSIRNPRTFVDLSEHPGRPDGATVDSDGCLWSALIHSGQVARYTPAGRLDQVLQFPVSGVTSCAFGGPRLDTLFVTTATQGLSQQALQQQPLAGALFAATVRASGVIETPFKEGPSTGASPHI